MGRNVKRTIFLDIDGTVYRKTIILNAMKRNPRFLLRTILKNPKFFIYGAMYKLVPLEGLRRRIYEQMRRMPPIKGFDVKHMDPEYERILRLAEMKGHRVVFLTTNPEGVAELWEKFIRDTFPNLNFEVRPVPTVEEKERIVMEEWKKNPHGVHFFDDSLPATSGLFNRFKMKWDKSVLLAEYEKTVREMDAENELRFKQRITELEGRTEMREEGERMFKLPRRTKKD